MTTTATKEAKAKAIVTTKLMADGTTRVVACKPIIRRIDATLRDCRSLEKVAQLKPEADYAIEALVKLLVACGEE